MCSENDFQSSTAEAENPAEFNLIDLSTDSIPTSNQDKWNVTDYFGFSSNVRTSTKNMVDASSMAKNPLELDIIDNQACLIPESVHKQTDHSKSMNAVRKYVNKMRREEGILEGNRENVTNTPARPLPESIPVQRCSNIILNPSASDEVTVEMKMNECPYFGQLVFDKNDFYENAKHLCTETEFKDLDALHFSGSE